MLKPMLTIAVLKVLFSTKHKVKTKILLSFHIFYFIFALFISELWYYKNHKFIYYLKVFLM